MRKVMKAIYQGLSYLFIIILCFSLAACGTKPKEETAKELISGYFREETEEKDINNIEIMESESNKKDKSDTMLCKITFGDQEIQYEKYYSIVLRKDDTKQWNVISATQDVAMGEKIWPLKGVSEEEVLNSLNGIQINVEGEEWNITKDNVSEITIKEQNTDLENLTDDVIVEIKVDDVVAFAQGTVQVKYGFIKNWTKNSEPSASDFTMSMKLDKTLDIKENDLIKEIQKEGISYGEDKSKLTDGLYLINREAQTIQINDDEISGFEITDIKTGAHGTYQYYDCSYTLEKKIVTFDVKEQVTFYYDPSYSDWCIFETKSEAIPVEWRLEGIWKGTSYHYYNEQPEAQLEILNVTNDGQMEATYSFVSEYKNMPGKIHMIGEIESGTLQINFTSMEWVEKPKYSVLPLVDKIAYIWVDESRIEGNGYDGVYNVYQ